MRLDSTCVKLVAAVMLFAALPSFAAPKRRAVNHPAPDAPFTASVKGTVLDATTGAPVAFATISFINAKTTASKEGTFEINNVSGFGVNIPVVASRTGYNSGTQTISGSGNFTLTFRLQSRPTVSVRMTNGSTLQLDDDSVKLGYSILFSGYVSTTNEKFCKADGTQTTVSIADMKKITGPAINVLNASCCARDAAQLERVRLELRSGETGDVTFTDSCPGYVVDLLGRNHTSGDQLFLKLSEVAEVVFP